MDKVYISQLHVETIIGVYDFEKEKMTLSVPVSRAKKIGLRPLCTLELIDQALDVISETAQTSRGIMWSRRAQEYEKKIALMKQEIELRF